MIQGASPPTANPQRDDGRAAVLPNDAPYLANLAALWAADPILARQVESLESSYPTEPSKAGPPTLCLAGDAGRAIYLHSRYQPIEEARRLIDGVVVENTTFFYLHGLGLGYHLEQLFDRCGEEALFSVFEPDILLVRTLLLNRDISRLIESRRVLFFYRDDKPDFLRRIESHSSVVGLGTVSIDHSPSLQLQPEFHQRMKQYVEEFASYCRTSLATLVLNGRRTAENVARNLGWYASAPGIERLRDRHKGEPAIIVSAGPSLRKNKHLLKKAVGHAVIVAVQTTLQPLLELGIEPNYVTSLDYHDICTRFFERLPPTLKTELVAEPKATNKIFQLNPGPLTLLGNEFAEKMLREMHLNRARLPAGATVAHLAFSLAQFVGCDPIILVGQDLGFSDGLCYAPGTSYEDVWRPELSPFCTVEMKQWEQIVRDRKLLRRIPDHQGRPMYTEERLFTYLQQFERDFTRSQARIIDATEGGALKRGTIPMALATALHQYCTRVIPDAPQDHPGLKTDGLSDCLQCLQNRIEEAQIIERICRDTLPLLEEVNEHLADQARVNRVIARIDRLRARMDELTDCYELIIQITQTTELQRFKHDRQIAAARLTGEQKQRRQVERDMENVRGIIEACIGFRTLTREVIESLSLWEPRQGREIKAAA